MYKLSLGASSWLDLLRGLSAQAVLVGHGLYFAGLYGPNATPQDFLVHRYAVCLFFLLSGFLIAYSVDRKSKRYGTYGFGWFFTDRALRIYVTLIPALVVIYLCDLINIQLDPAGFRYYSSSKLTDLIGNLLMLQYFPGFDAVLGHRVRAFGSGTTLWTLSIEWWIYLFYGWAVLRVFSKRWSVINLLVWLPLCIVPVAGFVGGRPEGMMILWLIGAVAYFALRRTDLRALYGVRGGALFVGAVLLAIGRFRVAPEEYDAVLGCCTMVAIIAGMFWLGRAAWPKWLSQASYGLAAYSYTLYLIHYSIFDLLRTALAPTADGWTLFWLGCLASNAVAAPLGYLVEVWATSRLKRWAYRQWLLPRRSQ